MLSATFSLFGWMTGESAVLDLLGDAAARIAGWAKAGEPEDHVDRLNEFVMTRLPVIYAADHLSPVGYRWKTQLNENPKLSSFFSSLPEANHNEVNSSNTGALGAIFLMSNNYSRCTRASAEAHMRVAKVTKYVESVDEKDFLTEMLKLTLIGDLFSLRMAQRLGVDALGTPLIDDLKAHLGKILKKQS
jgi:glucose/mannose-6-phosphate isomerase